MDGRSFDALVKAVATGANRRSLLKGMLGLGGGAVVASLNADSSDAARRPTPTPKPLRCPGVQTPIGGVCTCPPEAPIECGSDCCTGVSGDPPGPDHSECCDNACCFGHCYAEEACCPYPREYCPGANGNADGTCCPEGFFCCEAGTAGRYCLDPAVGECCKDSDCPAVGLACGACVDNQCVASPCGVCEACADGTCVSCEAAGFGCCGNETDQCEECCDSETCGPYHNCQRYICLTCEENGQVPCGEPPCPDSGRGFNCCCDPCTQDLDCQGCEVCDNGACISCEAVGLQCFGDQRICGECNASEQCGPYHNCEGFFCLTCEEIGQVPCGEPPCPTSGNGFNCCCDACSQDTDCDSCEVCSSGACVSCESVGLSCFSGTCGECNASEQCGPYYNCQGFFCLTCEENGQVPCGEPPCPTSGDGFNCCCDA